jgi:transcriptional regulator with XRE-family HTH domain
MNERPLLELLDLAAQRKKLERLESTSGSVIRNARLAVGASQNSVAAAAGISPAYLCQIEANTRPVSTDRLESLTQAVASFASRTTTEGEVPTDE